MFYVLGVNFEFTVVKLLGQSTVNFMIMLNGEVLWLWNRLPTIPCSLIIKSSLFKSDFSTLVLKQSYLAYMFLCSAVIWNMWSVVSVLLLVSFRVCGSGVCDCQRSSIIYLQSVSECVFIKLACIVLSADLSYCGCSNIHIIKN